MNPFLERYLSGDVLYGDDFDQEQIAEWFRDEERAYFELNSARKGPYSYSYHPLNYQHGFRWLPPGQVGAALGLGSAFGDEFKPLAPRLTSITIVEPAAGFRQASICGVPATYVAPSQDGSLPFPSGSFQLILSLGTLHHIPNVSRVLGELARCLAPSGYFIIREPTISMGDWTRPRPGLTKRERGIPLVLFRKMIEGAGLTVIKETQCIFGLTPIFNRALHRPIHSYKLAVRLDQVLCSLFSWNRSYHAVHGWQKLRATAVYFVLTKD